jgi:hypothetical protein
MVSSGAVEVEDGDRLNVHIGSENGFIDGFPKSKLGIDYRRYDNEGRGGLGQPASTMEMRSFFHGIEAFI